MYAYKLDIIEPMQVKEFVSEFLDLGKIASITTLDTLYSTVLYGMNALPGAIIITLKKKAKTNPKVAGLTMKSKKYGDNFEQRKAGEILISE
jgi:hypothetical protein